MKRFLMFIYVLLLAAGAVATAPIAVYALDIEDGEYAIEVTLEGGSGKASITSPCELTVLDGQAYALLEWSSPYYDYMLLDGKTYFPINEEGNSTFEIPVTVFDEGIEAIVDTTAMSVPHEINYTLTFYSDKIMNASETPQARARYSVYMAVAIIVFCMAVSAVKKRQKRKHMEQM